MIELYSYVYDKISNFNREYIRNSIDRLRCKNKDFSIISSNCIGGMMSHDLGMRFNSPTVNLYFEAEDYIKFLENLDYYLQYQIVFDDKNESYPLGFLCDIKIHFLHYASQEMALNAWEKRKRRVNKDNLFIIMTDRDGCNEDIIKRFDRLPYENKIIFTSKPYPNMKSVVYLKKYKNKACVGIISNICSLGGKRGYNIDFDYISWLNQTT